MGLQSELLPSPDIIIIIINKIFFRMISHLKSGEGENTECCDVQLGQQRLQLVLSLHILRLLPTDRLGEAEVHHSDVVVVVFVVVVNAEVHGHTVVFTVCGEMLAC